MLGEGGQTSDLEKFIIKFQRKYRQKVEKFIIYPKERWACFFAVVLIYLIRVISYGGFYVVSYVCCLYILHLSVQFLTPQGLPNIDDEEDDDVMGELPVHTTIPQEDSADDDWKNQQEQGPLIRSMNEFKYWHKCMISASISLLCTSSELFDLPVFWPFLLCYFMMLLVFTVRRQVKHMQKYNYSPLDFFRKSTK